MASPSKNLIPATTLSSYRNISIPISYANLLVAYKTSSYYKVLVNRFDSVRFKIGIFKQNSVKQANVVSAKTYQARSYTIITFPPVYKVYGSGSTRLSVGLIYPSWRRTK